ncbi:hypothetical protein [Roseivirga sp.]|uniref:hypothetical protein n=1 Tax=Roseivirga sp. TaxID=1964215 RepID=UPI003B5272D2
MRALISLSLICICLNSFAQNDLLGLWEVNEVTVGDRQLTPTAKWFLFEKDGTLTSGNGNIENFGGTFEYNSSNKELMHSNGKEPDPYGPFKTRLTDSQMTWERMEDGIKVVVQLSRVDKKPKAPWDLLQGGWQISKSEGVDPETGKVKSLYDIDKERYFFMWDRAYRKFNSTGQMIETGVWHIGGHSNEVWTISNADNTKTKWQLSFEDNVMIWSQKRGNEMIKVHFERNED